MQISTTEAVTVIVGVFIALTHITTVWMLRNVRGYAQNGLSRTVLRAEESLASLDGRLESLDETAAELSNVLADLADLLEDGPEAMLSSAGSEPSSNLKELIVGSLISNIATGLAHDSSPASSGDLGVRNGPTPIQDGPETRSIYASSQENHQTPKQDDRSSPEENSEEG